MSNPTSVREAMLRHPTVHPAELTVAEARAVFEASPKIRIVLLARDGVLVSTLLRDDLADTGVEAGDDAALLAADRGTLEGRTIGPDALLAPTREAMVRADRPRLAVVDADGRLLGLLCLKRSQTGFCTDEGVAGMRQSRAGSASSR